MTAVIMTAVINDCCDNECGDPGEWKEVDPLKNNNWIWYTYI